MNEYFKKMYKGNKKDFNNKLFNDLKNSKKKFVVTANPETFMLGTKDKGFNKLLLDKNTTLVPDGIGVILKGQKMGYKIKERITGIDLASELIKICNENSFKLALLGSTKEVINKLVSTINKNFSNIKIVKAVDGYNYDKKEFFKEIKKTNPDVCLVALGIPEQEKIIYEHFKDFKKGIFVGVGGSFDVLSGTKKRAPKIFRKLNLEWLYRIIKEPKRIKRFWNYNIKFLFKK